MAAAKKGAVPPMSKNVVGKNLRLLRKRKNLSQEELAVQFHVTRQTISNWESGKSQIELETLKMLAEFFAVPIERLIYDTPPEQGEREENFIAFCCRTLAKLIFFFGFISGIATFSFHFVFSIFTIWGMALFSGLVLLGIAEIISLLERKE